MNKLISLAMLGTAALALNFAGAHAATASGSIGTSITVAATCNVDGTSAVDFGTASAITADVDATGSIDVTCTNTTGYTVALDAGANSTSTSARKMSDGNGNTVDYALYLDSARTSNWGDTVGTDTKAGTGNGSQQTITVYGRVPAQPNAIPAAYTDTVNVTVSY